MCFWSADKPSLTVCLKSGEAEGGTWQAAKTQVQNTAFFTIASVVAHFVIGLAFDRAGEAKQQIVQLQLVVAERDAPPGYVHVQVREPIRVHARSG